MNGIEECEEIKTGFMMEGVKRNDYGTRI